ncbi:MAG: hypothetical protein CL815_04730 [Coraliomargarita sp.]|nr:hypothetical protein [Coraliomargarita sp.]
MATTEEYKNGGSASYSFSIEYIKAEDIKVKVDGTALTYTATNPPAQTTEYTVNGSNVIFKQASVSGSTNGGVRIYRETELGNSDSVTFQPGSSIRASDLNANHKLVKFSAQEKNDQLVTEDDIIDGAVTSAKIRDNTIVNADINASAAIDNSKIADGLLKAGITVNSANIVDGSIVDADVSTSANIQGSKLANDTVTLDKLGGGTLPSDIVVTRTNIEDGTIQDADIETGTLDNRYYTETELNNGQLNNVYYTETELDGGQLDNRYYTETELNPSASTGSNVLDARYYTETEAEARFLRQDSSETIASGDTWSASDSKVATTSAIDLRIIDLVDDVGGFVAVANETSFPTANPDVNNGTGTIVSVTAASTALTPNVSTVTIANGAGSGNTVTITGVYGPIPAGYGFLVETTTTLHTYTFHRLVPKATEVSTIAANAVNISAAGANVQDIHNFADLYQISTSAPTQRADASNLSIGDLWYDSSSNKVLMIYDGSSGDGFTAATPNAADLANISIVAGQITYTEDLGLITNAVATATGNTTLNTVAGIATEATTVAGIASDVTAVAADATDIGAVAAKATEIGRLGTADAVADMNTLGTTAIVSDMDTLADISSNITTVAGVSSNVTTVAGISGNVTAVAGNATNISAVAADATDIGAVAGKATEIGRLGTADAVADLAILGTTDVVADMNTLATSSNVTNMNTLAGVSSNVTTVAGISSNVTTVAGNNAAVSTVALNDANISTVAGNNANITTVAGANSNISTVAGSIANVNTAASNIANVNNFANRYRIDSSDPGSNNDEGDLYFNTTSNELRVYNGSTWQGGVTATGNLAGLGANTFTGTQTFVSSQTFDGRDVSADGAKLDAITTSSGAILNGVTATTQSAGDASTKVATTAYTDTAITNLVDSSPSALNTLNELAAALGDDASFSTTVTNSIATKLPLAGGTLTGNLNLSSSYIDFSGSISAPTTAAAIYRPADNTLAFSTANTERFRVTTDKVMLSVDLKPDTDSVRNLGTNTNRFANGYFDTLYGDGSNLTSLNASNISSGTISSSRIPTLNQSTTGNAATASNAALLDSIDSSQFLRSDQNDTFTGDTLTFNSSTAQKIILAGANSPYIRFREGSTDKGYIQWDSGENPGEMIIVNQESGDYLRVGSGTNGLKYTADGSTGTVWTSSNDGSGSGLDSDTVDGIQASSFVRSDASDTLTGSTYTIDSSTDQKLVLKGSSNPYIMLREGTVDKAYFQWNASGHIDIVNNETAEALRIGSGTSGLKFLEGSTIYTVWHTGNDGSGSGLDADTVDGIHGTNFLRSDTGSGGDTANADITFSGGAGAVTIAANSDIRLSNGTWSGDTCKLQHHSNYLYIIGGSSGHILRDTSGHNNLIIESNGNVTAIGNVTAYSDKKLKTDISTINDALGICGKLRGVSYKWIRDGKPSIGVIAQEVEKVIPEIVLTNHDLDPNTGESIEVKSVDYGKMVGVLINAINELKAEVEELKGAK